MCLYCTPQKWNKQCLLMLNTFLLLSLTWGHSLPIRTSLMSVTATVTQTQTTYTAVTDHEGSTFEQEGAAVEGPPAMGPSLQLSTCVLFWGFLGLCKAGKGSLRHLPNIKLIGQQAAKLWGFFANNAISRHDFDLWPLDLEIGPRGASVRGTLPTKFSIRRPFRFPSRWRHGTDRQTDRRTDRINTWRGLLLGRTAPYKSSQTYSIGLTCLVASVDAMQLVC